MTNEKFYGRLIGWTIFIVLAIIILSGSMYTVESGERAVVLTFGEAAPYSIDEGLNFKIPFAQKVKIFEVRTKKLQEVTESSSKDMQVVTTTMALNYHINPEEVHTIFSKIGAGYEDRIIKPAIQEATKGAMAQYKADELINLRAEVSAKAKESLSDRLLKYNIIVDDFNLIDFGFSKVFDDSIEAKQKAEQDALTAENNLRQKQVEAQVRIAEAGADAESTKLRADAEAYKITAEADAQAYSLRVVREELAKSNDLLQYEAIKKWSGSLPNIVPSGSVPFVNIPTN